VKIIQVCGMCFYHNYVSQIYLVTKKFKSQLLETIETFF